MTEKHNDNHPSPEKQPLPNELIQEHLQLLTVLESVSEIVYVADPTTYEILYANPLLTRIFGEVAGKKCYRTLQGFDEPCRFCTNPFIFGENLGEPYVWEFFNQRAGRWFRCFDRAIHWPDGRTVRFEMAVDITDLKEIEQSLRESEARYRRLTENAQDLIWRTDAAGTILFVNRAVESLLGYRVAEVTGESIEKYFTPESNRQIREWVVRALAEGKPISHFSGVVHHLKKDGRILSTELSAAVVCDEEGRVQLFEGITRDISRHEEALENLRASEARLATIGNAALDAIIMMDDQAKVAFWNPAAEKIFGYSAAETIGQEVHRLLAPPRYREEFDRRYPVFLRTGEGAAIGKVLELEARHRDGREFPVEIALAAIPIRGAWWSMATIRDISARKKAETELRKAKELAESATRAKSDFLAKMSHEIRTPMNAIIGMTRLTLDTELSKEQLENLKIIETSADALLGLIDDILDFSKIEAGRFELEKIDFNLQGTLEDLVDTLAVRAAEKNLELLLLIDADVPVHLCGDPTRLRQIMINLIGNALKFTERGEVIVTVESVARREEEVILRFKVKDTGIGIPPEKQQNIFDAFTQADDSTTRKFGGTGLGLTISKQLATLMNGEIGLESALGEGSTFWFTARFARQTDRPQREKKALGEIRNMNILIVDDNAANRQLMMKILHSWECRPAMVKNGMEALALLRHAAEQGRPFALVLLDILMPEMDGFETALRIKQDPAIRDSRLIVLTSVGRRGDVKRLQEIGVSGYLVKPIKQSQLLDAILEVIGRKPGDREQEVVTRHVLKELDITGKQVLLVEDNTFNQKVATKFLKNLGLAVTIADNGRKAVEAVKNSRFDVVLMDIQMPEMDGYEATGAIRAWQKESGVTVPIIAMTAHAMKGDREKCLAAGMDDYLPKPINEKLLAEKIQAWTSIEGLVIPAERTAGTPSPAAAAVLYDLQPIFQKFENDRDFIKELAHVFIQDVPRDLERLSRAIALKNGPDIGARAHGLKGMSKNFGLMDLGELFYECEKAGKEGDEERAASALARAGALYEKIEIAIKKMLGEE